MVVTYFLSFQRLNNIITYCRKYILSEIIFGYQVTNR